MIIHTLSSVTNVIIVIDTQLYYYIARWISQKTTPTNILRWQRHPYATKPLLLLHQDFKLHTHIPQYFVYKVNY